MAPRAYTLGRRAESAAATRERILEAAAAVYRAEGYAKATLQAIAARADVSRGTILHHFGDASGLLEAVLDGLLERLDLPDQHLLDGVDDPDARLRTMVDALYRFYDRSADWWQVFTSGGHDLPDLPSFKAREAVFWTALGRLQAAALGPAAADPVVQATLAALLHPWTEGQLRWVGMDLEAAIEVMGDLVVDLVHRRAGRAA